MAFKVISHTPVINEEQVYRNAPVTVTFSSNIIASSVESYKLSINDSSDFTSVPGTYAVAGNTITFTPSVNMVANTKYTVFVHGKPNSVLSSTNEQLETTYSFEFTTGASLSNSFVPDSVKPVLLSGILVEEESYLRLFFNSCIDDANISGNIYLSTYDGMNVTQINSSSWTDTCRVIDIPIESGTLDLVKSMAGYPDSLSISFPSGVFFTTGIYNNAVVYQDILRAFSSESITEITYGTESGVLSVVSIYPQHMEPNIDPAIEFIKIKFNKNILSTSTNLSGLISIQVKDVLY